MAHFTDCEACPLRSLHMFLPFSLGEIAFMRAFKSGEEQVQTGETILHQGERSEMLYTVLEGFGTRTVLLEDGCRQVISVVFPGDFIGLQAGNMGEMRHSIQALTPMRLCIFRRSQLWDLFKDRPDRADDLTLLAAVEEHFRGETIATPGQRDATERISWALARIWQRLTALGLVSEGSVPLPFRQHERADALGLSAVHTSRTVAVLREMGWSCGSAAALPSPTPPACSPLPGWSLNARRSARCFRGGPCGHSCL